MHQTFGSNVSRAEQLMRTAGGKQVGRKHNHTKGPSRVAQDLARKVKNIRARQSASRKAFVAQVRAYWDGYRETHP